MGDFCSVVGDPMQYGAIVGGAIVGEDASDFGVEVPNADSAIGTGTS